MAQDQFKHRSLPDDDVTPLTTAPSGGMTEQLLNQLRGILYGIPFLARKRYIPPVIGLDDSESSENIDSIPGLRNFRDSVSKEIEVLEQHLVKIGQQRRSNFSTNAPYFIAVWNEILSAPLPIVAIGKTFSLPPMNDPTKNVAVKVDVVANEGRTWIRVNTIKNSRIMAEFREFDSYLTDSEDDSEDDELPSPEKNIAAINTHTPKSDFPTDQDNSLLKMGRDLITASSIPLIGTNERPKVVLRLTRLDPSKEQNSRIDQVIADLRQLGLDVQLGEQFFRTLTDVDGRQSFLSSSSVHFKPTIQVSLDLSVLIALVSDLTHAQLPINNEEAKSRFLKGRQEQNSRKHRRSSDNIGLEENDNNFTKHSRALFLQCLQEMDHGIIDEMVECFSMTWPIKNVQFWTTEEARDRSLQIVEKVGGPNEKRRARAMFQDSSSGSAAIDEFWKESRYSSTVLPSLLPIRIHQKPTYQEEEKGISPGRSMSLFQSRIFRTCRRFLQHAPTPHPRLFRKHGEMERAQVSSLNTKLTMHTVESILVGVLEGKTIITANKASVKTLLREMKDLENREQGRCSGSGGAVQSPPAEGEGVTNDDDFAVIWIIEPRSLAEGMRQTS